MPNINVQHLVALTLVDGGLSFESSNDPKRMSDTPVLNVRQKIELKPNAELTTAMPPRQVIITAHHQNGSISTHHAKAVRGTPDDPMTRAEVMTKAVDLTSPILGTQRAKLLAEQVMRLDEIPAAGAVIGELIAA